MHTDSIHSLAELDTWVGGRLNHWNAGSIILLSGNLGAGKTTLVRSVITQRMLALGKTVERVTSPTFVIHQSYPEVAVEHLDLYRFENAGEAQLIEIGYYDILQATRNCGGLCFVEWPEKARAIGLLDADRNVSLELNADGSRTIHDRSLDGQ